MNNTAKLAALQALYDQLPKIECQGLCHGYCGPLGMTRLEAKQLPELTFDTLPGLGRMSRVGADLKCVALKFGRCSVYERRPAICRLWGLTDKLQCPFGCQPSERWTDKRASEWLKQVEKIGL